ncbi:hypothetical protein GS501_08565 [Saccharibacter sp. 17.LH.SD]|uniref:Hint domain-containing protein n=1 Tax=Saccharibacter sp. 17.LH.SD TaxID=2689393 RepID=UPI00136AFB9A|nr:Hint domain-containing protein [Saccharibacter sp. 17.LH.SD]MXV45089.1 hypothetical protein [Saccharibacter sp. 17.LH.SD]
MSEITWSKDTTYTVVNQYTDETQPTGSVLATYEDFSAFKAINDTTGVISYTIAKGTILSSDNPSIIATLTFNTSPHVTTFSGFPVASLQIVLDYQGYQTYEASSGPSSNRTALEFSFDHIVPGSVMLQNGNALISLDPDQEATFIRNLQDGATNYSTSLLPSTTPSNGTIALLPTFEMSGTPTTSNLNTDIPSNTVCFLAGAEIRTPEGLKRIEDIVPGDIIMTYSHGQRRPQKVTSICQKDVTAYDPDDTPVRFKAHALAENIPYKDLSVTGEHCLFLNGVFIPARMLVNHHSIVRDSLISHYKTYHIECAQHTIICANGAYTETYLDTTHRINKHGNILEIGSKTWVKDAAAPLATQRNVVEPIWHKLAQRSKGRISPLPTTDEPNLHLLTNTGAPIKPYRVRNNHFLFHIPKNIKNVRLISRTSRPSDVIGPFVDDRRHLGVLIDALALFQNDECQMIETPFQETTLQGWDVTETSHCRWTNGAALLPLGNACSPRVLSIHVSKAGPYLIKNESSAHHEQTPQLMMSA